MEHTYETWEEERPIKSTHVSDWWEFQNDEDDSFSMTYKGREAFRMEFPDGWGIETYIINTPDYWRWVMAITQGDHFYDEVHDLESGLKELERLRG